MEYQSTIGTLILIFTGLTTYKGLMDDYYQEKYLFYVDGILMRKEYYRLWTSGFLHSGWLHFGFNMLALIGFSFSLEMEMGWWKFILIYASSLLGGSLLSLYIHRLHGDYRALGASGAISGIVLSSIILYPEGQISLVLLPLEMPSWLFAIFFVLISIFGIKSQEGLIGHDAHLGGALTGVLVTLLLKPSAIITQWWIILLVVLPTLAFLILIVRKPEVMMINNYWWVERSSLRSPLRKQEEPEETLDYLLDKIRKKGLDSLTKKERDRLDGFGKG
jgi:membrane associated rhomboid family serine protease